MRINFQQRRQIARRRHRTSLHASNFDKQSLIEAIASFGEVKANLIVRSPLFAFVDITSRTNPKYPTCLVRLSLLFFMSIICKNPFAIIYINLQTIKEWYKLSIDETSKTGGDWMANQPIKRHFIFTNFLQLTNKTI